MFSGFTAHACSSAPLLALLALLALGPDQRYPVQDAQVGGGRANSGSGQLKLDGVYMCARTRDLFLLALCASLALFSCALLSCSSLALFSRALLSRSSLALFLPLFSRPTEPAYLLVASRVMKVDALGRVAPAGRCAPGVPALTSLLLVDMGLDGNGAGALFGGLGAGLRRRKSSRARREDEQSRKRQVTAKLRASLNNPAF